MSSDHVGVSESTLDRAFSKKFTSNEDLNQTAFLYQLFLSARRSNHTLLAEKNHRQKVKRAAAPRSLVCLWFI